MRAFCQASFLKPFFSTLSFFDCNRELSIACTILSIHFVLREAIVITTERVCFELGRYAIVRLCGCHVVKNTLQVLKNFQSYKMVAHCRNPDPKPCISTYKERQNAP